MYLLCAMTHLDIINRWPSLTEFADDLAIPYGTAKAMRRRGTIPVEHWPRLITKAAERGVEGVTPDALVQAVAKKLEAEQQAVAS